MQTNAQPTLISRIIDPPARIRELHFARGAYLTSPISPLPFYSIFYVLQSTGMVVVLSGCAWLRFVKEFRLQASSCLANIRRERCWRCHAHNRKLSTGGLPDPSNQNPAVEILRSEKYADDQQNSLRVSTCATREPSQPSVLTRLAMHGCLTLQMECSIAGSNAISMVVL